MSLGRESHTRGSLPQEKENTKDRVAKSNLATTNIHIKFRVGGATSYLIRDTCYMFVSTPRRFPHS